MLGGFLDGEEIFFEKSELDENCLNLESYAKSGQIFCKNGTEKINLAFVDVSVRHTYVYIMQKQCKFPSNVGYIVGIACYYTYLNLIEIN